MRDQVYKGMTSAARGIVQQYGVRGLYTGIGITMVEIVPYAALQFGLYDLFNSAYSRARVRVVEAMTNISAGSPLFISAAIHQPAQHDRDATLAASLLLWPC